MVKKHQRPYVTSKTTKGRTYYYYRKGETYTRLPDNPDSPEFDTAYWSIRSGRAETKPSKTSFKEIAEIYLRSPDYKKLKPGTKANYRRVLDRLLKHNAKKDFTKLRRRDVIAARDAYADTWRKANEQVEMLSTLARHAINLEWITANPAQGVEKLKGGSYEPWPDWALRAFVAHCEQHNLATALLAHSLCIGTGQRIGDICKMEWRHYDGEAIAVQQEKTDARLWVACPAQLRAYLDALPRRGRFILAKNLTQHLSKSQVQKVVMAVRKEIGATDYVIHGWRYNAAKELAEAGCSDSEIAAVTGHRTLSMVQKYRRGANQRQLSKQAQEKRD